MKRWKPVLIGLGALAALAVLLLLIFGSWRYQGPRGLYRRLRIEFAARRASGA